jgi:hypothetical protein
MASHIPATSKPSRAQNHPQGVDHTPDLERHQRKCVICHHPDREAIEELFVDWHSPQDISEHFDLEDWSTIYRHARATGLYNQRGRNVRSALERVIEYAGHGSVTINGIGIVRAVRAYACLTDTGEWIEPATRVIVSRAEPTAEPSERHIAPLRRQIEAAVIASDASPLPLLPPASQPTPASPARKGSRVDGESSLGDQTARGIGQSSLGDSAPLISLARVRSGWRPGGRVSNRQPAELETPLTPSKQRTAPNANRQK